MCEAVWEEFGIIYLYPPSKRDWKYIAEDFNPMWNFSNCVGVGDITISCYNYKVNYSIVLLASCDVDIGNNGSQSDGGVLRHSCFG